MARVGNFGRRLADNRSIPFAGLSNKKSKISLLPTIVLLLLGVCLLIFYSYHGSGGVASEKVSYGDGDGSCTLEVQRAIPKLRKVYGESMNKVLHVGPGTCTVVPKLLKEKASEAWGVEPYELDDADSSCRSLVSKGIVRVADIKFPLPYKPKSFSLVILSDALDYLSPNKVNKTLLEMERVSENGLVVFTGYPGQQRDKHSDVSKFGRPAKLRSSSWWAQYLPQNGLEENESARKEFESANRKSAYEPTCQIFHLKS